MAHRAGLAGQSAALDGGENVEFADTLGSFERLGEDHLQDRAREIFSHVLAVDLHLAGAALDPHTGGGVLAATGRVGATQIVDLRLSRGGGRLGSRGFVQRLERGHACRGFGGFNLGFVRHVYLLFFAFIPAMSSAVGCCA